MEDSKIETTLSRHSTNLAEMKGEYLDKEDAVLASLGKKPQLHRVYNFWTCTLFSMIPTATSSDYVSAQYAPTRSCSLVPGHVSSSYTRPYLTWEGLPRWCGLGKFKATAFGSNVSHTDHHIQNSGRHRADSADDVPCGILLPLAYGGRTAILYPSPLQRKAEAHTIVPSGMDGHGRRDLHWLQLRAQQCPARRVFCSDHLSRPALAFMGDLAALLRVCGRPHGLQLQAKLAPLPEHRWRCLDNFGWRGLGSGIRSHGT